MQKDFLGMIVAAVMIFGSGNLFAQEHDWKAVLALKQDMENRLAQNIEDRFAQRRDVEGAGRPRMLGRANPFRLDELPHGRLKKRLESLSERARERAMEWMHRFDFPVEDLDSMAIDQDGGVFYVEPALDELPSDAQHGSSSEDHSPEPFLGEVAEDTFQLHSRPGAPNVLFLDFDGRTLSGTVWSKTGVLIANPFDLDGDSASFSAKERNAIAEIWHRVAEDYAPFDIDVTTEEPASFGPTTGSVLITSRKQADGSSMPHSSAGGVAYVGVWGAYNYGTYWSPALVYYDNLAKSTTYVAEAVSHEFGHHLGLSHDATSSDPYYHGHGSGSTSWAPIMGVGYYKNVTQWSKGEYPGATNNQDDLAIIAERLSLAADDHGDAPSEATPLLVDDRGEIRVTNPEIDPHKLYPENKGIIETSADQDVFSFATAAGDIELSVYPAWDAFYRSDKRGANLDVEARLLDALGNELAHSNPSSETHATISLSVPAGTYFLEVSGVGNGNYSGYASIGQYFISGFIAGDLANQSPNGSFSFSCLGLNCQFTDSSTDSDGSIETYAWHFGDGNSSALRSPGHTYAAPGVYTVTLTVTDDDGASAVRSSSVAVSASDVVPPLVTPPADINAEATAVLTPLVLGAATTDDGSPVTHDAPAEGFPLGTTRVTWQATDAAGNMGSATQMVTVVDTTPPELTPPADVVIVSGQDIGSAHASDIFPVEISNDAPSVFPQGETVVIWKATDSSGNTTTAAQVVTVTQQSPEPHVNFNGEAFESFAGEDRQGTVSVEDGGTTLRLTGNTWKRLALSYDVSPRTVLEFDFRSDVEGEIHGIGLDEDGKFTRGRVFKLYGGQAWNKGILDYDNYDGSGWTHYRIPVGQFYTGKMSYMVFVMDDDGAVRGESRFRNVKIYEDSVTVAENVDFEDAVLASFAGEDRRGTATIEDDGATLRLVGNTWKRLALSYDVGPRTVLEFDFRSDVEGEIHGIGLDEDGKFTRGRVFKLYGGQAWNKGILDYDNYDGSGWTHYRIPVGQFYTGKMSYMVFVMDDDGAVRGESRFRNISLRDE